MFSRSRAHRCLFAGIIFRQNISLAWTWISRCLADNIIGGAAWRLAAAVGMAAVSDKRIARALSWRRALTSAFSDV